MCNYLVDDGETLTFVNTDNEEIEVYFTKYSDIQKRRFKRVLNQMMEIWYIVIEKMTFLRLTCNLETSNFIMNKIHNLFFITYKDKIDYYENLKKNKNIVRKKINKLKTKIYEL